MGYANNTRLAKGRTQALVDYVTSYYNSDNKLITSEYTSEGLEGFRKFIAASSLEKKDEILKLMDDSTLDIDKKERQIAQLAGPQTYKYILEECYPALRSFRLYRQLYRTRVQSGRNQRDYQDTSATVEPTRNLSDCEKLSAGKRRVQPFVPGSSHHVPG